MVRGRLIPRNGGSSFPSAGRVPSAVAWLTIAVAAAIGGCGPTSLGPERESRETIDAPGSSTAPEMPATGDPDNAAVREAGAESRPAPLPADSGDPVWARGFDALIAGLDGELYEGYQPETIEHVQEALRERGLYGGPAHGVLDAPTMRALYVFQDASYGLQPCGVPTPRTRRLLEQGSHT
jgi:hypothetical protein